MEEDRKLWQQDLDMISKLVRENEELQEKIDEALEYISSKGFMDLPDLLKLADILKN